MQNKNILHVVAGNLSGGAARGAYWLHLGLIDLGYNSKILINSVESIQDITVTSIITNKKNKLINIKRYQLDQLPLKLYRKRQGLIFSTATQGFNITKHPLYKWADIIHLHWINGGFINTKHLAKIRKPMLWTMRDMWPFTGGCHVSMGCEKYKTGCGSCIQLGSIRDCDLSRFIIKRKQKYYPKNMKIVGISNWLSECARESKVFKEFDVRTIYNNINCNDFFPVNKSLSREMLGIKTSKQIILAGAQNSNEIHKGFDNFKNALRLLDKDKFFLAFFGRLNNEAAKELGFEYKNFGVLHDIISLRLVYSAADVFVAPTQMDAFGKTLAEAMACGTPVVCFDATGPKDIVDHKQNGYKAKPFESDDLSQGIIWVLNNDKPTKLSQSARLKAVTTFDSKIIAKQYISLYQEIVL